MIKYFQYDNIQVKVDETAKLITKVVNSDYQKAISTFTELGLYNNMIQKSKDWIESDAATFDLLRSEAIAYLQSI